MKPNNLGTKIVNLIQKGKRDSYVMSECNEKEYTYPHCQANLFFLFGGVWFDETTKQCVVLWQPCAKSYLQSN